MAKKKKSKKEKQSVAVNKDAAISRFRNRIMSDETVKYIYSEKESILHDKHCLYAKEIPDSDLFYEKQYLPSMKQCPKCALRAYISSGAKDSQNISMYLKLFKQFQIKLKQIRHMYIDCGMQTEAFPNMMMVWDREDAWKIQPIRGRGQVCLYHNNYHINEEGKRVFDKGFHIQSEYLSRTTIDKALEAIETYSYSKHRSAAKVNSKLTNGSDKEAAGFAANKRVKGLLEKVRGWFAAWNTKETEEHLGLRLDNFKIPSRDGYPHDGERCVYIWEGRDGERKWQVGAYEWSKRAFTVQFGNNHFVTDKNKVIAWKRIDSTQGIIGDCGENRYIGVDK